MPEAINTNSNIETKVKEATESANTRIKVNQKQYKGSIKRLKDDYINIFNKATSLNRSIDIYNKSLVLDSEKIEQYQANSIFRESYQTELLLLEQLAQQYIGNSDRLIL